MDLGGLRAEPNIRALQAAHMRNREVRSEPKNSVLACSCGILMAIAGRL